MLYNSNLSLRWTQEFKGGYLLQVYFYREIQPVNHTLKTRDNVNVLSERRAVTCTLNLIVYHNIYCNNISYLIILFLTNITKHSIIKNPNHTI